LVRVDSDVQPYQRFSQALCLPNPPAAHRLMIAEIAPDTALIPYELAMIPSLV
jgi:hypothetical protein